MSLLVTLAFFLPTLLHFSVASRIVTQTSVFLTIATTTSYTQSHFLGTDRWTEKNIVTSPSWTQPFYNSTATPPNSCYTSHSTSNNSTITPSTTISWHETISNLPTSTVVVGARGNLAFSPPTVNAAIGTVISFNFLSLNHTLTQSEFSNPCQANGRFDTGFRQFNPANASGMFVIDYEVTSLEPQWFFCAQTLKNSHCHAGMIFSLNPGGAQNQFLQNALSMVATIANMTSTPICHLPTFSIGSASYGTSLPSSTGFATSNISLIGATPTAIVPIVNGAGTNTVRRLLLVLACIFFM